MSDTIKGIIFDFNGTMLFDEHFQTKAWRSFLESLTGRSVSDEELHTYVHGRNAEATFSYFLHRELPRQEVAALEEEKEVVYRSLCLRHPEDFHLVDGLPQFLDELTARGITITIATASALNNVRFFFEHLKLGKWFDPDLVIYSDGTIPGKPEPDIYLKAAERIGLPMESCAVFEDSRAGVKAAVRAGAARVIGVSSMLARDELLALGASDTIGNYRGAAALCDRILNRTK